METVLGKSGEILGDVSYMEEGPGWFAKAIDTNYDMIGNESYHPNKGEAIAWIHNVHDGLSA